MYNVLFTPAYERDYERLSLRIQRKVDQQIQRLRIDPGHPSLRTHKRKAEPSVWQTRVTRSHRCLLYTSDAADE